MSQDVAHVRLFRQQGGTYGYAVRFAGETGERIESMFGTQDGMLEHLRQLLAARRKQPEQRIRLGCGEVP